jgi:hypothetical protein
MAESRNDRELLARTSDRYIQPPASTLGQKRTEAQRKIACSIFAVTDADDDCFAFVPLDPFETLDEEARTLVRVEEQR